MSERKFNARIINKHDSEENWAKATNFIPEAGELIVYDVDSIYTYERIKIGDGTTLVNNLPFVVAQSDFNQTDETKSDYIKNKPTLGDLATKDKVAKTDLASDVQSSLEKADSALQSYTETDPTVPAWAKESTKPSYTKSEVGLGNVDNVKQYSASNPPPYPVTEVNNKTGAVTLSASDVGADASGAASSAVNTHNANTSAHADIREQISQLSSEKVDKTEVSLGIASDGLIYIFVDGNPVGTGIPQGSSVEGDVFGYIDENNTIVLTGALADGTYSIKYEMDDGSTVDIGDLVLDSNIYYSIASNLTNCTSNNSALSIAEGESYSATITANDGHELKSVSVTMGGSAVSVSGGVINIASVTGNIVITAVAEAIKIETNFVEYDASNTTDWSKWINNARVGSDGTYRSDTVSADYGTPVVSNYIAVQNGDIVEFSGIYAANKSSVAYKTDKSYIQSALLPSMTLAVSDVTLNNAKYAGSFKINSTDVGYIRIGGYIHTPSFPDIVIKIKRNGEYL